MGSCKEGCRRLQKLYKITYGRLQNGIEVTYINSMLF